MESETESIRYTTARHISPDEELCIFYGHSLWFEPSDIIDNPIEAITEDNAWGGLSHVHKETESGPQNNVFLDGDPEEMLSEGQLPFTRIKLLDDEDEDELGAVQTGN